MLSEVCGRWFWWSWGWFFSRSSSSGFATISIITKTTPRTTKTTRQISSCGKFYSSYFWGGSLIKCRDYKGMIGLNSIFLMSLCGATCKKGVETTEIRKGRIWAGLRDIWRVFLEILPLQKSKEKRGKT